MLEQVFLHFPAEFRELNEYEAKSMLTRLGFTDFSQKVGTLSGGQRKRVALVAALVHPADILVLDDSSSALDYRTDAALRKALLDHYADITKVMVAQRISSIAHADLILVLSGGAVIARGTHEELLASCDLYRELYDSQMGGLE